MLELTVTVMLFKKFNEIEIIRLQKDGQHIDITNDNNE